MIVTLTLARCFSSLFVFLYTYTYTYTYCYYHYILYFLVLTKPAPAWVPVKASFSTSDTIVTLYRHRSTNRFVSLQGTEREPGIFLENFWKKLLASSGQIFFWKSLAGKFFLRIASESEKVFAKILDEFSRCFDLTKISVFSGRIIQNFETLTDQGFEIFPWALPIYFQIGNHFNLFQKSFLNGYSQYWDIRTLILNVTMWLCVNIYTICQSN